MSGFKTKARTVELLGRKQIRDSVTALAELMKNAYDADAPWLRVEFDTQSENQHVVIADRGIGMSKEDIINKWLVLGTNSKTKKTNKKSLSGRPLMGAKGIGRLASATLGTQLWMFTKSMEFSWNIVFINWNIFENPYISIEEVSVPTRFDISTNELLLNFDGIITEMLNEQRKNIELPSWNIENDTDNIVTPLRDQIFADLQSPTISKDSVAKYLTSFSSGTILYVDQLHDDWNMYISPASSESRKDSTIHEKMYNRFASFVSTFKNTEASGIPFNVELYIDGEPWEEDFNFNEDDYKIYDIKVVGKIESGMFTGQLLAENADPNLLEKCNDDLKKGLDVTAGISNWRAIDCGEFSIKFCHIEGQLNRSGLSKDDYSRIKRKLETTCGISVYRDGVRVLPYGEPENDFLGIEERRSERASRYIFSHRNIFGRIDINTEENPMLEDKSSREGLIENAQYFYFVQTLKNLLTLLALNYLSTVRKESLGIQQSYIDRNSAQVEINRIKEEYEKKEQAFLKGFIKRISIFCVEARQHIDSLVLEVSAYSQYCANEISKLNTGMGYDILCGLDDQVKVKAQDLKKRIALLQEMKIDIPVHIRDLLSDEQIAQINTQNVDIDTVCKEQLDNIDSVSRDFSKHITKYRTGWINALTDLAQRDALSIKTSLLDRLSSVASNSRNNLNDALNDISQDRISLVNEMQKVLNFVSEVQDNAAISASDEWRQSESIIAKVSDLKTEVENLFSYAPDMVVQKTNELINQMNLYQSELVVLNQKILYAQKLKTGDYARRVNILCAAFSNASEAFSSEQIIGVLRQDNLRLDAEMEIYSDLANMGLASEIVNHEFNQLFINVNNAIKNMTPYIKDSSAKYWLRQIDMGFRSISDRQNQLSPMYRSYSLKRANTVLRDFIDEVRKFTEGELIRNEVEFINQVPSSAEVIISKSKVFPAISNLINNSIFWVLNSSERKILVRYDEELHALYIEDSGAGISAVNKEKIFEPFVSYKPNGRGLGLTVARKVLESQGHKLEIATDDEKTLDGACFKITFAKDAVGE